MEQGQQGSIISTKGQGGGVCRRGNFLYLGEFPQTIKEGSVTINKNIKDDRGYFLGSDGYYYASLKVAPKQTGVFSSGEPIVAGKTYHFRVEPVRFRILEEKKGEALLLCDRILTARPFAQNGNSYEKSEIRAYLNGALFTTLFAEEERAIVLTTKVDNSQKSTGHSRNKNASAKTDDKLFLLSVHEARTPAYQLLWSSSTKKAKRTGYTDYALASGLSVTHEETYEKASWWLRSPASDATDKACFVAGYHLSETSDKITKSTLGILPAFRADLSSDIILQEEAETEEYIEEVIAQEEKEEGEKQEEKAPFVREGKYIYFGEYPQTIKEKRVRIDESTTDHRGYYLGSDGCYYAKVQATPEDDDHTFSTGGTIKNKETYYFKVEPIRWRILSENGKEAFLLCDSIIEYTEYSKQDWSNKRNRSIRFLNETFFTRAFNAPERQHILTTKNKLYYRAHSRSSQDKNAGYAQNRIFLLCEDEARARAYGFFEEHTWHNPDPAKRVKPTDYSKARGVYCKTREGDVGFGYGAWILRSGYDNNMAVVYPTGYITFSGHFYQGRSDANIYGLVPAMRISLTKAKKTKKKTKETKPKKKKESGKARPKIDIKALLSKINWKVTSIVVSSVLILSLLLSYFLFWMPAECVGAYYTFGEFPQTLKKSSVWVDTSVMDERGYYLGSDGAYYAEVKATSHSYSDYEKRLYFPSGEKIEYGETYYFKVEPVRWRVLSKSKDEILLIADKALYGLEEHGQETNWLNDVFFNTALSKEEQERLLEPIFLPTTEMVTSREYGFSPNTEKWANNRKRKPTDLTASIGYWGQVTTYHWAQGCVRWMLSGGAVSTDGSVGSGYTGAIVPAIRIQRKQ